MESKRTYRKKPLLLLPTSYEAYLTQKGKAESLPARVKRGLHRFPYRYRLAKSFIGIDAYTSISTRDLLGYSAGMKIVLAYTAYEEVLRAAEAMNVRGLVRQISNEGIANQLRKNDRFMNVVKEVIVDYETIFYEDDAVNWLAINLKKFINKNNDILSLAKVIRNLYAHGEFTSGGVGITSKATQKPFLDIADEVLKLSDEVFDRCVMKLEDIR